MTATTALPPIGGTHVNGRKVPHLDVLRLIAAGATSDAIAHALGTPRDTVDGHVRALLSFFNARCRAELVHRAHEEGVLSSTPRPPVTSAAEPPPLTPRQLAYVAGCAANTFRRHARTGNPVQDRRATLWPAVAAAAVEAVREVDRAQHQPRREAS